jgi:PEP-CTERM motif
MKNLRKMALVLVGFASIAIQTGNALTVTVSSNNLTSGHMNVFNLDGTYAGWGSGWGIPDLRANFSNGGSTVTLLANNIGDPATYWYIGGGALGNPGNKKMEANLYNDALSDTLLNQSLTFNGVVDSYTFNSNYVVKAFIKDFAADYSSFNVVEQVLNSVGSFSLSYNIGSATGRHIQYGLQTFGANAWGSDADAMGSAVISASAVPEPSSAALMGLGVAGLLAFRMRRKV